MPETPTWKAILDGAYDRWNRQDYLTLDYPAFVATCGAPERNAMLLGSLNYQVTNGGFRQWVDNGYGLLAHETISALRWVGGDNAAATIAMIQKIIPHIAFGRPNRGWADYWLRDEWSDDCIGEEIADHLDEGYYAIMDALMTDIEAALKAAT